MEVDVIQEDTKKEKDAESGFGGVLDELVVTDVITFFCFAGSVCASNTAFWPMQGFICWWALCGGAQYVSERYSDKTLSMAENCLESLVTHESLSTDKDCE